MQSFFWYDLETSGTSPALDRIMQFAGQRTDMDLNPIEAPFSTHVQLPPDIVPSPEACLVTGITPQRAAAGLAEWDAVREIHARFATPETCVAGYNNLRFDDEFIRHALYRNLLDPYAREWRDGNSRWDLIDVARAASALRPDGIEWPIVDEQPTYRLSALAQANGIDHDNPHDATADVEATIALARLLQARQPKLFGYALTLRAKHVPRQMLTPLGKQVCVHASGMFPNTRFCTAPVMSVAQHPHIDNAIVVVDLGSDVQPLIDEPAEALREALFGEGVEERPPLKEVRLNRCPFLAPLATLRAQDAKRLGVNLEVIQQRADALRAATGLAEKIARVYQRDADEGFVSEAGEPPPRDVEERLYDGFTPDADRATCAWLHQGLLGGTPWPAMRFEDARLAELAERLRARLRPESLDAEAAEQWRQFVATRLAHGQRGRLSVAEYRHEVAERLAQAAPEDLPTLRALEAYGRALAERVAE